MEKLKLGVARKCISPEIGGHIFGYNLVTFSTAIHDDLHVTAFAFSYGETKAIVINATICIICYKYCEKIRRELSEMLDVPCENITISATHTHETPSLADADDGWLADDEYYQTKFHPAVIEAAKEAMKKMEPVTVGHASGNCYAGINRRQLTLNNEVVLGQNPWGPFNPEMNIISFKGENGKILANIITYSAHATAAGGYYTEITRDWPGVMTDAVENTYGGLTVFFNTTMGDSGPRLSNGLTCGDGYEAVEEVGNIAAHDALEILGKIKDYKDVSFALASRNLQLPLKPRKSYEEVVEYLKNTVENPGHLLGYEQKFHEKIKESYENGYIEKTHKEIQQTIVRIGNVALAAFPFEMFAEVGFRIDSAVKDLKVVTLSYTNGQFLYMPTQDQLCRGGHEVFCFQYSNVQQYADDTDFYAVTETLKNIENLER